MLIVFFKMIQTKLNYLIVGITSDHGTEIENVKIKEFCLENGISHNFLAPRTPQQNGEVERKNRTLVNIAKTMLIESIFLKISGLKQSILHAMFLPGA